MRNAQIHESYISLILFEPGVSQEISREPHSRTVFQLKQYFSTRKVDGEEQRGKRIEISRGRKAGFSRVKREIPRGNRLAEISFPPQPVIRGLGVDQMGGNINGEVVVKVILRFLTWERGRKWPICVSREEWRFLSFFSHFYSRQLRCVKT